MSEQIDRDIERFLKRKDVIAVLGDNYALTVKQQFRLMQLFEVYGNSKKIENMLKTVAFFIKNNLTNYVGRYRRLKGIPGTTKYTQLLRYGKHNSKEVIKKQSKAKTAHFPNKIEYWINKGYSDEEATQKVREIQTIRSKKSTELTKGSSAYTARSMSYWINKGYSDEEATQKVREIQTTNGIDYYVKKYGKDIGKQMYSARINKWQQTLINKTQSEKDEINYKKRHAIDSYMYRGMTETEAMSKYNKFCQKMKSKPRQTISKISQDLFFNLHEKLKGTCYFGELNYEQLIDNFRVDFFHKESKVVIEFYGDYFHRNPKLYESSFVSHGYTSKQKWKTDKAREEIIKTHKNVNQLVIVWESSYRRDKTMVIDECLNNIGQKYAY